MLPPGPRAPATVNTAKLALRPIESLLGWHRRYGDVVTVPILIFGTGVYVADPAAIREMFTGDQSDLRAGEANAVLSPVLGDHSVLVLDGAEHLRHRRLLLPPLKGAAMHGNRQIIRDVAEDEVARWNVGDTFAMRERMRALTFEVIARIVFGVSEPARIARLRLALTALIDSTALLIAPSPLRRDLGRFSPWGRFARLRQRADALVYEEIALRRGQAGAERSDVLSLLMAAGDEDGRPLTDAELRDELMTMLLAGHETTATGLAFAFDLLLHHPDVLARLAGDLDDTAYLDAVVTESLRLRPVIDAAQRTLKQPRVIAGHEVPAGVRVYPSIVATHYREDLFPEPTAFRPERFLEGGRPAAWMPFGGGIRRCIGASLAEAEMAEVLRVVLSRVQLRAVRPRADPVVMRGVTLVPRHGVRVQVSRRSPATPSRRRGHERGSPSPCPASGTTASATPAASSPRR
jgi:cytochrome P450